MANPQQPESSLPGVDAPGGPVPPDNQPGHHPAAEQDKPDLNAFAERLGATPASDPGDAREEAAVTPARRGKAVGLVAAIAALVALVGLLALRRRRAR